MQGGEFIESDTAATNFVILARNCFHRFLQPNQGRTAILKGIQKDQVGLLFGEACIFVAYSPNTVFL